MNDNYKYPVNLLKTNFDMKGNLFLMQPNLIKFWYKKKIFNKFSKLRNKYFILHDGPPFTNGEIHLGHIFNKILKDFIIKYKNFLKFKSPYIIGWDCLGLPIEKKIKNKKIYNYKIIKKYNLLKNYVLENINKNIKNFYKIGIVSNYNFCYKTISNKCVSEEVRLIYNFYKKNLILRKNKILNWCFNCKSIISNSEIFYKNKKDLSLFVVFLFIKYHIFLYFFKIKKKYFIGGILIWTTLPWTLMSSQLIYCDKEKIYVLINTIKGLFILNLKKYIFYKNKLKYKIYLYKIFLGFYLNIFRTLNPLFKINIFFYKNINVVNNIYNIKNYGTEILHLSPNHGETDYIIYSKFFKKKKLLNLFNSYGEFKKKFLFFNYKFEKINKFLINYLILNNKIFNLKKYKHDYMFCLKDNKPIIYKSTKQLYLNFKKKKKYININLKKNIFFSKNYKNKFINTIKKKPDWIISRQRLWGNLIPNFIRKKKGKFHILKYISNFYEIYSFKYWYKIKIYDIYRQKSIFFKKLYDTLDNWIDSGVTHWTVLRSSHKNLLRFPSDLYLEGEDQYRGWFQSSFITSILLNNKLPFKKILSHSFIKTVYGDKLSKSLNNYINFANLYNIISIDILRLLICNLKYNKVLIFTKNFLINTIEIYRKIRNCLRFIISNISDFKFIKKLKKINIFIYLFSYINLINKKIIILYDKNNFKEVLFNINVILSDNLSNFYFELIKNFLYIEILKSKKRKIVQLSLFYLLKNILFFISPIIPFTSEEIWNKLYYKKTIFYKKYLFYKKYKNKLYNCWNIIKNFKYKIYKKIESIKSKIIISNSEIKIILFLNKKLFSIINNNIKYIKNILFVYKIKNNFWRKNIKYLIKFLKKKKCKRCWSKNKYLFMSNICKSCYIKLYKQNILF